MNNNTAISTNNTGWQQYRDGKFAMVYLPSGVRRFIALRTGASMHKARMFDRLLDTLQFLGRPG